MALKQVLLIVATATLVAGQRPSFAGSRPIGYPEIVRPTTTAAIATDDLGNRFGEDNSTTSNTSTALNTSTVSTTTQRLPIEANGDRDLVDRLSKLPIDKQPFWFINWQAYEANRNNPQTYDMRPSSFALPINHGPSINSGLNNNFNPEGNLGNRNNQNEPNVPSTGNVNNSGFNSNAGSNVNTGTVVDTSLGNRNGEIDVTNTAKPQPLAQTNLPVEFGNRKGDNLANPVKTQQSLQTPVNNAAFVAHPGVPVSGNSFGNRFGSENSGLSTAMFNPNLNTQPSRTSYPDGQYFLGNRYPGEQNFGSNMVGNRYSDLGNYRLASSANVNGVPYPVWANYRNQFTYDRSNLGRFKRDLVDTETAAVKKSSIDTESEDTPFEIITAFNERVGKTILDTAHLLEASNKKSDTEQIEKNLQETNQILEEINEVYAKYGDNDSENIDSSGLRIETSIKEAIRKELCENRDKLAAVLSRAPVGHVKCDDRINVTD